MNIQTLLENTSTAQKAAVLQTLLENAFPTGNTANDEEEISGADFLENFCGTIEILQEQTQANLKEIERVGSVRGGSLDNAIYDSLQGIASNINSDSEGQIRHLVVEAGDKAEGIKQLIQDNEKQKAMNRSMSIKEKLAKEITRAPSILPILIFGPLGVGLALGLSIPLELIIKSMTQ